MKIRDNELNINITVQRGGNPKLPYLPPRAFPYENADVSDDTYFDGRIANRAIEELQKLNEDGESFFLAVGFKKPHLPFNAPKKYWDIYNEQTIKLASNPYRPKNVPATAIPNFGELRGYYSMPEIGPVPDTIAHKLVHGYYAYVSYMDAQVGKVLNELEKLEMSENTIVILWGDHGWHLGEHNLWCKHCNFRKVLRIPLIVRAPGKSVGAKTEGMVESVDIYPTLCELAGLKQPFYLQGKSFVPLLDNPDQLWKDEVFCRYKKGETILTERYAYTEWINDQTGEIQARMLYDHRVDPEENINISELAENRKLIEELHQKLIKHLKRRDKLIIPDGHGK